FPEVCLVLVDARRVRTHSGQKRGTRRIAERVLAVAAIEAHAPVGEPVDVGRPHDGMTVAAERRVLIVGRDGKNIQPALRPGIEALEHQHGAERQDAHLHDLPPPARAYHTFLPATMSAADAAKLRTGPHPNSSCYLNARRGRNTNTHTNRTKQR